MTSPISLRFWLRMFLLAFFAGSLTACATAPDQRAAEITKDPYEDWNRKFYAFNDALDKNILAPVSRAYVDVTPAPARTGIHNFIDNLIYPKVFINDFLQGKVEQGFEDAGRFVINSTFGLGGFIDFAGGLGFVRNDEDFGQTFAVWGMGSGPYLELPFLGPNTGRDALGLPVETVSSVLFYADFAVSFPIRVVQVIDTRAGLESAIKIRDETALDPYIFQREAYLQRRRHLIYDGNPPPEALEPLEPLEPGQ